MTTNPTPVAVVLLLAGAAAAALAPAAEQPPYTAHVKLGVCPTPDLHHCFASTPGAGDCPRTRLGAISIEDTLEDRYSPKYLDPGRTLVGCRGDCAGQGRVLWETAPGRNLRFEVEYAKAGPDTRDAYDGVTLSSAQPRQERALEALPGGSPVHLRWPYRVRVFHAAENEPIACIDPDIFIHRR